MYVMAIISNFLELKKLFSCKSTHTNDQSVIRVLETIAVCSRERKTNYLNSTKSSLWKSVDALLDKTI